jgi:hypothetical protein
MRWNTTSIVPPVSPKIIQQAQGHPRECYDCLLPCGITDLISISHMQITLSQTHSHCSPHRVDQSYSVTRKPSAGSFNWYRLVSARAGLALEPFPICTCMIGLQRTAGSRHYNEYNYLYEYYIVAASQTLQVRTIRRSAVTATAEGFFFSLTLFC